MATIRMWIKFNPSATEEEKDNLVDASIGSIFRVGSSLLGSVSAAARQTIPPDEGILLDVDVADLDQLHWLKDLKLPGVITG